MRWYLFSPFHCCLGSPPPCGCGWAWPGGGPWAWGCPTTAPVLDTAPPPPTAPPPREFISTSGARTKGRDPWKRNRSPNTDQGLTTIAAAIEDNKVGHFCETDQCKTVVVASFFLSFLSPTLSLSLSLPALSGQASADKSS